MSQFHEPRFSNSAAFKDTCRNNKFTSVNMFEFGVSKSFISFTTAK